MRDLLGLADQKDSSCESVDAIAREHLAEVERKVADLGGLRRGSGRLGSFAYELSVVAGRGFEPLTFRL